MKCTSLVSAFFFLGKALKLNAGHIIWYYFKHEVVLSNYQIIKLIHEHHSISSCTGSRV